MIELYFVYALDRDGCVIKNEKRVTDSEHLDECVKSTKHDFNVDCVYYNKCCMCFDGYLVQGSYCGCR